MAALANDPNSGRDANDEGEFVSLRFSPTVKRYSPQSNLTFVLRAAESTIRDTAPKVLDTSATSEDLTNLANGLEALVEGIREYMKQQRAVDGGCRDEH
ncbi:hypothetical protein HUO13_26195 [Saccharopolyspora erythraea]|uniref:hypothetical protein n=1 Tax=Saccharopolyspora erythraea TaxID=1836 RepID=UPI001BA68F0D|nr:hypothetical protein [Saccharopolyspora erythraea]QUH03842.1 hypothetical protein HUO13_26195 [Saccharopolyspora erythraea]